MIELMKLDEAFDDYHEDVEMAVPFDVRENYEQAPEKFLPRMIAERAKLYCRKRMDLHADDVQAKWFRWVARLLVFTLSSFLFFAILTALGMPTMFFSGENREARVLAVSVLIGVMSVPCLLPLVSLVSLISQRLLGRPQAVIADVVLWIFGVMRDGWASIRGKPLPSQRMESTRFQNLFKRSSYFASASFILLSDLYFVLMGVAIWGVLWLFLFSRNVNYVYESSLCTAEERAAIIKCVSKPVTYVTGTPAPGPDAMSWANGTFVFDEKQFVDVKDGTEQRWSPDSIETYKRNITEGFRRDWSRFLLSSVWTWVFLPRVAVAIVAGLCVFWFYEDFRPKHSDPRDRRIVAHIRKRRSQVDEVPFERVNHIPLPKAASELPLPKLMLVDTAPEGSDESSGPALGESTHFANWPPSLPSGIAPPIPDDEPTTEFDPQHAMHGDHVDEPIAERLDTEETKRPSSQLSGRIADVRVSTPAKLIEEGPPTSVPRVAPTESILSTRAEVTAAPLPRVESLKVLLPAEIVSVVGYGLGKNGGEATRRLAERRKNWRDYGNLNGAKEQLRFMSAWKSGELEGTTLVILFSLTSVPSFGDFLSSLTACAKSKSFGNQPAIKVVLTDGIRARERLEYDPDLFDGRVSQWRDRIERAGVDHSNIFEFDISSGEGAIAALNALAPSSRTVISDGLIVAGKTKEAVNAIRKRFTESLSRETETQLPIDWMKQLALISEDLSVLYKEEKVRLLHLLNSKKCSEEIRNAIDRCALPVGLMPEELQTLARSLELFKTVSPKWICAGAMGGLGLGAVAGVVVLAGGGLAAIPSVMPTLVSSTLGGAIVGQLARTFGMSAWSQDALTSDEPVIASGISAAAEKTLQASLMQIIVLELQGNTEGEITEQLRDQTLRLDHHRVRNMSDVEDLLSDFQQGMLAIRGASNGI